MLFVVRLRLVLLLHWADEEDELVIPDSLRIGLDRIAEGGGFNLSVTPVDMLVPPGFFNFTVPEWEELPSNMIKGLFLLWSLLEIKNMKRQNSLAGQVHCYYYQNRPNITRFCFTQTKCFSNVLQ